MFIAEAEIRMKKLEDQWKEFERIQQEIEATRISDNDDQQEIFDQEEQDERQVFETGYFHSAKRLQAIIDRPKREAERTSLKIAQATAARAGEPTAREREGNPADDNANGWRRSGVKLPPLSPPEFDGDYSKWMTFRDCFEATIHNVAHIQNLYKFWYLRGALKGEAAELLIGIETTTKNYEEAWKLVKKTYDNRKLIVNSHLNELLAFPVIAKDKVEEHSSMKKFVLHIRKHMKALQALKQPVQYWDTIIIHLTKSTLDFVTQCEWEKLVEEGEDREDVGDKMPTVEEFLTFVERKSSTLELVEANNPKQETLKQPSSKVPFERKERRVTTAASTKGECPMCKSKHAIYQCPEFLALTPQDRSKEARDKRLCHNCLIPGHFAKVCKSSHCKKCDKHHNTLLHWEFQKSTGAQSSKEEENSALTMTCHVAKSEVCSSVSKSDPVDSQVLGSAYSVRNLSSHVLLSTALVYVMDNSDDIVKKLGLPTKKANQCIDGINNAVTNVGKATTIKIKSMYSDYTASLECLVLPKITQNLPQVKINKSELRIPVDIKLADPTFDEPGVIDILISTALFWSLLCKGQIRHRAGQPSLQQTKLGWIVGGELNFWRVESLQEPRKWTKEEIKCDTFFEETFQREETGRFVVKLPKKEEVTLGESREHAEMRLKSLERRFKRDPKLKEDYAAFLKDYEEKGHMQLVREKQNEDEEVYFIPHQPVLRPGSITTELRVVFDASALTSLGTSLNQKLQAGPNLQTDLLEIILRFRAYQVVITADIAQMFRQILIDKEDQKLQCIL
ncbi:uncharacterized protein LOC122511942 [Leptopilina heterotoma]|uniref:uncharacterized protein LOC122511942 n=1 Tax=Leptopilina heterotoma TaxID=63436 RepID=UPI001CA99803|nr:uncharacterized protein LOC122511942 [Leptopilina heterotoma]